MSEVETWRIKTSTPVCGTKHFRGGSDLGTQRLETSFFAKLYLQTQLQCDMVRLVALLCVDNQMNSIAPVSTA